MKLKYFTWELISFVQRIKFIQTMYIWIFIVPILVKSLSKLSDAATVTIFQHTFEVQLALPFSWMIFYFSALAFALANVLYQLRCPGIIKDHKDYADFKSSNKGMVQLDKYINEVDMNWEGVRQSIEKRDEYFEEMGQIYEPQGKDDHFRNEFWTVFNRANSHREYSRNTVGALYTLGSLLISIVIIQNLVTVIRILWQ